MGENAALASQGLLGSLYPNDPNMGFAYSTLAGGTVETPEQFQQIFAEDNQNYADWAQAPDALAQWGSGLIDSINQGISGAFNSATGWITSLGKWLLIGGAIFFGLMLLMERH